MIVTMICPNPDCGREFELEVEQTAPYIPAKLYGAPEDCYPEEGPEYEVTGPKECRGCGADLETPELFDEAIERAQNGEGYF